MRDKVKDAASAAHDDNPEWTEEDFTQARPASEVLPAGAVAALTRGRGRPPTPEEERKVPVSIRLSPEALKHFRATGRGWQTRMDDVLLSFVRGIKAAAEAPVEEIELNSPRPAGIYRSGGPAGRQLVLAAGATQDRVFAHFNWKFEGGWVTSLVTNVPTAWRPANVSVGLQKKGGA